MSDRMRVLSLLHQNRLSEAATLAEQLCQHAPQNPDAWSLLADIHARQGALDRVITCYDKIIALQPGQAAAHYNKGVALQHLHRPADAEQCYRKALRLDPGHAHTRINLGLILLGQGHAEAAADLFRALIADTHDSNLAAIAHSNLALALMSQDRYREAEDSCRAALAITPRNAPVLDNLGCALKEQGRPEEAVVQQERAVACHPGLMTAHSNLLLTLNYLANRAPAEIFQEHRRWARQHADPLRVPHRHENDRRPDRRLRVGYVSPDFRMHSVAMFLEPLLAAHDRLEFEIFGYANVARPDSTTDRLRGLVDHWRPITRLGDAQAADLIREDKIDILVDLAGHTAGHRLQVFARKPAPVQATWLGYPNTTGMAAMDYRITDAWADPPGDSDALHSETLLCLPHGFLCYQPLPGSPPVSELPSHSTGHVTFGCFNNSAKITPAVLDAWSEILKAVPDSRLLLKSKQLRDPPLQRHYESELQKRGIDPQRVEMVGRIESKHEHLALYGRVDIGLDPFPYNGTTTTCEALWMGVPVVVLAGDRHAGRVGVSLLQGVNLPEMIAANVGGYVSLAVALANDPARCASLRAGLRERMGVSPLCDAPGFARRIEAAYRQLWLAWCGA
jgi:predicted O-linked N-acetylglucosamine transferase (SPINDLY family)